MMFFPSNTIMTEMFKLIYDTAKVRLGFLIMACALAGIAVSPQQGLSYWQVLILGLAVLLSSASAGLFNQYYERNIDGQMKRTRSRPFVTGRFRAGSWWVAGMSLALVVSLVAATLATNVVAALYIFLGAFTYGVVYTVWLKRRTWLNIVVGGLSGSFAVMAGAAAVDSAFAPEPLILAAVLFLWTPPHFWAMAFACKEDYKAAGVPMLPVVVSDSVATRAILIHTIALVLLSLVPFWYSLSWIYLFGAVTGGLYFVWSCLKLVANPGIQQGWRTFAASIIQLGMLLMAAILDRLILG